MKILLDGREWQTEAEFIEAVLASVEAPSWHGRSYNALRDSFVMDSINGSWRCGVHFLAWMPMSAFSVEPRTETDPLRILQSGDLRTKVR